MDPKKNDREENSESTNMINSSEDESIVLESDSLEGEVQSPETAGNNLIESKTFSLDEVEVPEGRIVQAETDEDFELPKINRVVDNESQDLFEDGAVLEKERIDQNVPFSDIRQLEVKRVGSEAEEATDELKESAGFLYSLLDTLRFICLGLIIGMLLIIFVVQRNNVYGESMNPTLGDNDAVFVEMISVYFNNINRGDIIALDAEGMAGFTGTETIIKRVIGLPGETVTIVDGDVYINGELLDEKYLADGLKTYVPVDGMNNGYDNITLEPGQYYCLGDNRGASNDSRRLGPFSDDQIKSKVLVKIYPFDDIRFLHVVFSPF